MSYMNHHIFLPIDHAWKKDNKLAPSLLLGTQILELLKNFINMFGKKQQKKAIDGPLKKKSIFF